jgi:hypothetical protein
MLKNTKATKYCNRHFSIRVIKRKLMIEVDKKANYDGAKAGDCELKPTVIPAEQIPSAFSKQQFV